ncbi:unnamed protein product [Prorocentrum cordatum]|uniref:Poly(A) RNA polymerase mitochondrial-like central palm domain-containing protein n=1 Tax=Prorocentrum cordatum TaxID=2364126 RepID=A0ABN9SLS8_9DINO|nr:unnamed protein product [Polarella glacialis]
MQQRPAAHAEARVAELARLLEERLAQSAARWEEGARIRAALGSLEATLTQAGEEWCVRPFGSVPSTFHTCGADLDVTCLRRGGLPAGQTPASLMSEKIGPLFRDHPRFKILEEVLRARVPILKLRFNDLLDVDLSCQNTRGLQNTRLLRGYAHLDDRVRSLVKAVKLWAKVAGVCGASRGRLSSYSFALLAIYYMQVDQEVRLPTSPWRRSERRRTRGRTTGASWPRAAAAGPARWAPWSSSSLLPVLQRQRQLLGGSGGGERAPWEEARRYGGTVREPARQARQALAHRGPVPPAAQPQLRAGPPPGAHCQSMCPHPLRAPGS